MDLLQAVAPDGSAVAQGPGHADVACDEGGPDTCRSHYPGHLGVEALAVVPPLQKRMSSSTLRSARAQSSARVIFIELDDEGSDDTDFDLDDEEK